MTKYLIKLSDFIFQYKRNIVLFWLILTVLSVVNIKFNNNINSETDLDGLKSSEAYKVKKILETQYSIKLGNSAAIVIDDYKKNTSELENSLKNNFVEINKVFNIPGEKNHKTRIIYIDFKPEYKINKLQRLTPFIREKLRYWEKVNGVKSYLTGITAFQYDSRKSSFNESKKSEIISLIFCFIILIFTFGSLFLSLIPLFIGFSTILFFSCIVNIFSISINPISQILTGFIGLALGIDYSLLISNRFKEEIEKQSDLTNDVLKEIFKSSNFVSSKTIVYSGLIMFLSMIPLLMPDVSVTKTIVINLLIIVFISVMNSIFFLPAFLLVFYNILEKPKFLTRLVKKVDKYSFWKKFTLHILNHSKIYFVLSVSFLILCTIPVFNIKLWSPVITIAPKNSESIEGYNILQKDGWGGEIVPVNVIVKSNNNIFDKEYISYIYDITQYIKKNQNVEAVQSITSWNNNFNKNDYINFYNSLYLSGIFLFNDNISPIISNDKTSTLINVFPKDLIDTTQSYLIIDYIKSYKLKNNRFDVLTGGIVARTRDFTNELYAYIPQMLIFILISVYVLLFIYLSSVVLPIKAGIMNFLPILSSFGIVTLIFQYGYLKKFLNISFNGAVTNIVPLILFCLVFGLSMDYEIFILSRINEIYEKTSNLKESIIDGMARSNSIITGAAMILEAVFIPGIFSNNPQIQEICIGISSAIFIDATVVRLFLVPSFMYLMGNLNWWNPFKK